MKNSVHYLLFAIVFTACSTVPLTGRKQLTAIPTSQMLSLSDESYNQVLSQASLSNNSSAIQEIRQVGYRVTNAVEKYLKQNGRLELIQGYEWEYNLIAE